MYLSQHWWFWKHLSFQLPHLWKDDHAITDDVMMTSSTVKDDHAITDDVMMTSSTVKDDQLLMM